MTSPLPPRRRDTRRLEDLVRQDRVRLGQLDRGLVGGKFPPARPLRPLQTQDDTEDDFDDPAILFLNTDTGTVLSNGAGVAIRLTYEPLEGSEQVFYRGMALKRSDWTRTGLTIYIPGESWFKAGDKAWVDYAYEDGEPDPPNPILVGTTAAIGAQTSIALPPDTQAGDLILLVSATSTVSTSDSRIVGTHQAFGPGELVAWGYANGSGAPVAVNVVPNTSGYGATVVAVYRGVQVIGSIATNTSGGATLAAATIPDANAALVAVLGWNGTVAGFLSNDSSGAWGTDINQNHIKTNVLVGRWTSDDFVTTPAGSFGLSGDNAGFGAVTLQLGLA